MLQPSLLMSHAIAKRREFDSLFLSCAAAYADFVVAERKATHMLRQAARLTRSGVTVFATLPVIHLPLIWQASR